MPLGFLDYPETLLENNDKRQDQNYEKNMQNLLSKKLENLF